MKKKHPLLRWVFGLGGKYLPTFVQRPLMRAVLAILSATMSIALLAGKLVQAIKRYRKTRHGVGTD